jgi:MOSC domain-containing protein YiiM
MLGYNLTSGNPALMPVIGCVISIFITPEPGGKTRAVNRVYAVPGMGLEGDRYFGLPGTGHKRSGSGREITLIEIEALEAMEREERLQLTPSEARRNLVTQGVSLNDLAGRDFQVGNVCLRGVRLCEPCNHLAGMTDARVLPGLTHRGGLRAEILTAGQISTGDPIRITPAAQP